MTGRWIWRRCEDEDTILIAIFHLTTCQVVVDWHATHARPDTGGATSARGESRPRVGRSQFAF
jgi:hypothetical protein